jgi:hypothetical protein
MIAMFEYRKTRRRLKQEIEKADQRSAEQAKDGNLEVLPLALSQNRYLRDHYKMELEILESDYLRDIATQRFGLDVSLEQAIYDPKMHGVEPRAYFQREERATLRRMISKARFDWWKKWAEVLIPILSLLVAIIAILKS